MYCTDKFAIYKETHVSVCVQSNMQQLITNHGYTSYAATQSMVFIHAKITKINNIWPASTPMYALIKYKE